MNLSFETTTDILKHIWNDWKQVNLKEYFISVEELRDCIHNDWKEYTNENVIICEDKIKKIIIENIKVLN